MISAEDEVNVVDSYIELGSYRAAHLADIAGLATAHSAAIVVAALQRRCSFRRFTASDVRSIIAAGPDAPLPMPAGQPLEGDLPERAPADLDAFSLDRLTTHGTDR